MAITITSSELQTILGLDSASTAQRLLAVASGVVADYVQMNTSIPAGIEDEAMLRVAGYLNQRPAPWISSQKVGDLQVDFHGGVSPLRNSGAMALLSPFKQRRAV